MSPSVPALPLAPIVGVTVVLSAPGAVGPNFSQGLIVGPSTVIPQSTRLQQFTSLNDITTAGFSTSSPEYLSAQYYFGQSPAPTYLWIGRQDLTAIATVSVGASGGTGYAVGDILTVTQSMASGGLVKVTTLGGSGAVTGIAIIQGSQGTGYSVASNLATTGGNGTGAEVDILTIGETPLQAVTACRIASPSWYALHFSGTASNSDKEAIAAYIEAASPPSVYFCETSDATVLNNTTGNIAAILQALSYRRTLLMYSTTQGGTFPNQIYAAAAPMGLAMGLNTGANASYFTMAYKTITGIAAEPLTVSQANTICGTPNRQSPGLNTNCVLNYANEYTLFSFGTMIGGSFFDLTMFTDMLAAQIQINCMNLLTSQPSIPISNPGMSQFGNQVTQACVALQSIGFIAASGTWLGQTIGSGNNSISSGSALPKGFWIYTPSVSTLTQAQRTARNMPQIVVALIEAESAQSITIEVFEQN